jgi:hypothetical protein
LLKQRIEEHQKALDSMPKVDTKSQQRRLEVMGKLMLVMEREHMHKGAIMELKELELLFKDL